MKQKLLVDLLMQKKYKIASAESCTGGWFIGKLISVPNASAVIDSSFVTYSNEEKIRLLGVKVEDIGSYGVVSEQVAGQMAQGVARQNGANVGVGISGIAGPTGGTKNKPVGTVCFGFFVEGKTQTYTCHFRGPRNCVRKKSVNFAINKLIEILK